MQIHNLKFCGHNISDFHHIYVHVYEHISISSLTFNQLCDRFAISYVASTSSVFTISPSQLSVIKK